MEKLEFGPSCSASTGAERFLVALPTSEDLFICAKDLFVEAIVPQPPAPLNLVRATSDRRW